MFSYYKLGCRSFELNLFSHCFNLKDLNLNKHIERLRKNLLFALQLTDLTKCPLYVVYASRSYNRPVVLLQSRFTTLQFSRFATF